MKIAKTWFIICLLLVSMVIGIIPLTKAANQEDSFGYTYKDSNTGGPAYSWIEINETGTLEMPSSDNLWFESKVVDLGFVFEFYGKEYNQLSIGSTGMLFFEQIVETRDNTPILSTPDVHGFIAPFWDNMIFGFLNYNPYPYPLYSFDMIGEVYSQTLEIGPNRVFVVEWQGMMSPNYANISISPNPDFYPSGVTFEALLYEGSNNIIFQYKDVDFGGSPIIDVGNNGNSATVGIEDSYGFNGLEYSFNQPVISPELSILFEYPVVASGANLFVSINAPAGIGKGETMTYDLFYGNLGGTAASDVVLGAALSPDVIFVSASDEGIYDSATRIVTWNIGSVAEYPSSTAGSRSVTVEIPNSTPGGIEIQTIGSVETITSETRYDDNAAITQTTVTGLPENVGIEGNGIIGDVAGTPIIVNTQAITFTYNDPSATSVDINIHFSFGGVDITGVMTETDQTWIYTLTFGGISGVATATFTAHRPIIVDDVIIIDDVIVTFPIEVVRVDPAGYIYDVETLERVSDATVWLQMPNGRGGWTNVPTNVADEDAIAAPNVNPQITGTDGRYQWDTLPGTYRVHVEAPGYYPEDSIAVNVPPPVTDLHVGLVKIPLPQDNSPPIVQIISAPLYPIQVNAPVGFSSTFTDSDILDTHSAIWSWSDGHKSKGIVTETNGVSTVTGTRIYTIAGVYTETVTLTVTDSNGGSGESSTQQYIVIYDPNAGFVTGGGWINSPAGAFPANPSLTGKANFGFVSKYAKGANVPTGNTEFDFKVANINFHSTSYDWLVVGGGSKAQYKGTGTINGADNYGFMLTAIDSQIKGHGASDTFRIKIWDKTTGNTIYDNQLGASENADPSTTIAGGNIIIHTK
jgi:hypothetical protein